MFIFTLRKLFFTFLLLLFAFTIKAQQVHFIYLQTDNGQPFYAKLNNKLVSSSSEGYIILPNISDGVYNLVVGFPRNEFPEKNYIIFVDKNNEGFLLKNFDKKGWQLFNLQSLDLIEGTTNQPVAVDVKKKDEDSFSRMLAGVVKDSSILQNHDIAVPPPKPVDTADMVNNPKEAPVSKTDSTTIIPVNKSSTPAVSKADSTSISKVNNSIVTPLPPKDSSLQNNNTGTNITNVINPPVSKILSRQDNNGLQLVYVDKGDSSADTVRIFMPVAKDQTIISTEPKAVPETKNSIISSSAADTAQLTITPTPVTSQIVDTTTSANVAVPQKKPVSQNNSLVSNKADSLQSSAPSTKTDSSLKINNSTDVNSIEEKVNSVPVQQVPQNNVFKDSSTQSNNGIATTDTKAAAIPKEIINPDTSNNNTNKSNAEGQMVVLPKVVTASKVNSDCKDFATNEDFFKLRKKMAAESNMDDMLKIATKYFKLKCYSTEQIKDLSYLFLSDEGKYKFFDLAYAFTSDSDQYQILQSQFTDPYYLNRFKAMIRKY